MALARGSETRPGAFAPTDDCVIFRNDIALDYPVEVGIARAGAGKIKVEAYKLEYRRDASNNWEFSPRLIGAATISEQDFQQIVRLVESAEAKAVAAAYPPPGTDGWTWRVRRISNKGEVRYSFFCPEWRRDVPGIGRVLALGRLIARAAHIEAEDLSPALKEGPNNTADRMPGTTAPRKSGRP